MGCVNQDTDRRNLHRFYGKAKTRDLFDEYDSQELRCVKQTFEKKKVRRSEKFKSKFLISEVLALRNLRTDLQDETARQERCARGDAWKLAKEIFNLKEEDKATFYSTSEEWTMPVDSGASKDMVSNKDLNRMLLEKTPAVLSFGEFFEEFGYSHHWTSGQNPHLIKKSKKIYCDTSNHVPLVVLGVSTSSSTSSASPTSSSQETVTDTEIPATSRSERASDDSSARGNSWHESTEIENLKKKDDEEIQSGELQGVLDWLQKFKHGSVDESVPEHRDASSSSYELPLEPRAKVVPSKHNIFTHLLEDRNCDICLRTKIPRASCRRRIGRVASTALHTR